MNSLIDDYLVGDVTGTRYRIDDNGNILTPREIERLKESQILEENHWKKIDARLAQLKKAGDEEVQRIKEKAKLEVWKINHGIKELDKDAQDSTDEYLQKTIQISKSDRDWPLLYDIVIDKGACYYCSFDIIPIDIKQKYHLSNNDCVQARSFPYNDDFKKSFLEPFIAYQVKDDKQSNIKIVPSKDNPNVCDFYFITEKSNSIVVHNIDTSYAYAISVGIHNYQSERNRSSSHTHK